MNQPSNTRLFEARTVLAASTLTLLAACSGSSGGGGFGASQEVEPNDASGTATPLNNNTSAYGDVDTAGDVDFFSVTLAADSFTRITLRGTQLDQAGWDGNTNVPRLTIYDTDGTTKLFEHDPGGNTSNGWGWAYHDLDIPAFRAPATGTYFIAITQDDVTSDGGAYAFEIAPVSMGTLQAEAEGDGMTGVNDTTLGAQTITTGTIRGWHVDDEVDYYSFTTTEAGIVSFDLLTYRQGVQNADTDYFDPQLELYDTDGTTLIVENDDTFFYDSSIHYQLETAGTYFLMVTEYSSNVGSGEYFLTYGWNALAGATDEVEPNETSAAPTAITYGAMGAGDMGMGDSDFWSFSGTAGDMIRIEVFDITNSEVGADTVNIALVATDGTTTVSSTYATSEKQILRAILTETGTHFVRFTPDGSAVDTPYCFAIERVTYGAFETEGNDTIATANVLDSNGRAAGAIDAAADVDVYGFSTPIGRIVSFSVFASSTDTGNGFFEHDTHGSDLIPTLRILDSAGTEITSTTVNDTNGTTGESITRGLAAGTVSFRAPASGTYYVEVSDRDGAGSADHTYVISRN